MILGPLQPLKLFTGGGGFGGPNHASLHQYAYNTFTKFCLKDLTRPDNDNNMYLGPLVAA